MTPTIQSSLLLLGCSLGLLGGACAAPEGDDLDASEGAIHTPVAKSKPVREAIRVSCTSESRDEPLVFDFLYDDASKLRGTLLSSQPSAELTEIPEASQTGPLARTGTNVVLRAGSSGRAFIVDRFLPRFMHSEDRAFAARASSITVVDEDGTKNVLTCAEQRGATPAGAGAFVTIERLLPAGTYRGSGRTTSTLCAITVEAPRGGPDAMTIAIRKRTADDTLGQTQASIDLVPSSTIERMLLTDRSNVLYLEARDASGKKRGLVIDRSEPLHRVAIVSYGASGASTAICDEK